jgi:hypothetical protein
MLIIVIKYIAHYSLSCSRTNKPSYKSTEAKTTSCRKLNHKWHVMMSVILFNKYSNRMALTTIDKTSLPSSHKYTCSFRV